jgi:hypothetical protein
MFKTIEQSGVTFPVDAVTLPIQPYPMAFLALARPAVGEGASLYAEYRRRAAHSREWHGVSGAGWYS